MNREEAKEFLPLIQAFVEGKVIQYYTYINETDETRTWMDVDDPDWSDCSWLYRVKPESEKTNNTEVKNHTIMDTAERRGLSAWRTTSWITYTDNKKFEKVMSVIHPSRESDRRFPEIFIRRCLFVAMFLMKCLWLMIVVIPLTAVLATAFAIAMPSRANKAFIETFEKLEISDNLKYVSIFIKELKRGDFDYVSL